MPTTPIRYRKLIAGTFILIAVIFGIIFYMSIEFPEDFTGYFKPSYYMQFGPLALCVELLFAGYYLLTKHTKANFSLALFGFTALLDPLFNLFGLFTSQVPIVAMIIFACCALVSLWLAFTNTFGLGKISPVGTVFSFILGTAIELFFNELIV